MTSSADFSQRFHHKMPNKEYFTWIKTKEEGSTLPKSLDIFNIGVPEEASRVLIRTFTKEGDMILDPFCGFGEILTEGEKLGRKTIGIELDETRVRYCRGKNLKVITADSLNISRLKLPEIDACITSIPFYSSPTNKLKLKGDLSIEKDYNKYLHGLRTVFFGLKKNLSKRGKIIIIVKNLLINGAFIPLAWDVANVLREKYHPMKELIWIKSEGYYSKNKLRGGINHTYILVFKNGNTTL